MPLNEIVFNKFRDAFELKCYHLIIAAYYISKNEKIIQLDWNENDISSEIQRHIKENPLRKKWRVVTNVEAHIPKNIPKVKGFADMFPRIDFKLTTFSKNDEYEYFFEAKNLKQTHYKSRRRYIDTGIDNFVFGKYKNGSLIGYLLEGEIIETIDGINLLLKKNKRDPEILYHISNKLLDSYYESTHSNIGTLRHLIFDFTNISD